MFDRLKVLWLVTAMALVGAFVVAADAAPSPRAGPGLGGSPLAFMMMGDARHIDATVERLLGDAGAGATAEQREQVKAILKSAAGDLVAQRDAGRDLNEQNMKLFVQPTIDARAAEALRQKMLAQQDQSSRRMMQAMLDVSRVLTAEQRQKMAETMMARPPHPHGPAGGMPPPPSETTR